MKILIFARGVANNFNGSMKDQRGCLVKMDTGGQFGSLGGGGAGSLQCVENSTIQEKPNKMSFGPDLDL